MSEEKKEWTCPKCKASNDADFTRCRLCAEPNPDAPEPELKCAQCGHLHGGSCCPLCGSKEFLQL